MNAVASTRRWRRGRAPGTFIFSWVAAGALLAGARGGTVANPAPAATNPAPPLISLLPPPPPPLVLTNPPPGPLPRFPAFSAAPAADDISAARVFVEPLIPCGGSPSAAENAALAQALTAFAGRNQADDFSALENYLDNAPGEHWQPALLFDLGWEYYTTGYYSKALDTWEEDWAWLQDETSGASKALADRCLGELAIMHARIGDAQRLQELLGQTASRPVTGPATELLAGARQALWLMQHRPGIAFRCGPLALQSLARLLHPPVDVAEIVEDSVSSTNGFSLAQLGRLSQQLQLNLQTVWRQPGMALPAPCVVHWKVGHYAAILQQAGGRYFVVDPTFGQGRWLSQAAIDAEASGYFLAPAGALAAGWRSVGNPEAATVFGKGVTGNSDPNDTTPYDEKADPDCVAHGMAVATMHLMLVSLHLEDTPLAFAPPRGPPVTLTLDYNQREANQPATFTYANFGAKWTCNWISYLTDNGTNPPGDVTYYVPGGGTETFSYNPTNSDFDRNWRDQASLVQLSSSSYQINFPDGSQALYGQTDGTLGNSRKIFLTQVIDPAGYTNDLNYDPNLRLVSVTDPQAAVTNLTFYYAASGGLSPVNIYQIQEVTDRYGRPAYFGYTADDSELQTITDPLGITSQFGYAPNSDFIQALQTPYGASSFAFGDDGNQRWLQMMDPQGAVARAEFNQSSGLGIPDSDPGPVVPRQIWTRNYILYGRNTFYWDKKAMAEAPGNYAKARLYHWLHNANLASAEGCLESVKEPLENRVWFNYPGQAPSAAGATIYGTQNLPSAVDRVLDDGTEQLYQFGRNSLGRVTNVVDPAGVSYACDYAANQMDLLRVRNTSLGGNDLDASFTYNAQHRPLTAVDASGQTTRFSYNPYGQLTGWTNALLQATALDYDPAGRLLRITGPTNADVTTFGYDAEDRVNAVTNADGYYLTTVYDALNRPVSRAYPDGSQETVTYRWLDPQTYVDRAGRRTSYVFDSQRRLTQFTTATNWTTYLGWCPCGSLASVTDPLGRATQWFYDLQGRLTGKESADGSTVGYGYEQTTSRVKTFTNERNQTRTNSYFANNWLAGVAYANPAVTPPVSFSYDAYGRITQLYDAGYYDLFGRVTTFAYQPVTTPPAPGAGRLQTITDPNGYDTLAYTYDALGRVRTVTLTNTLINADLPSRQPYVYGHVYTYDVLGRVSQDAEAGIGAFIYGYTGFGPRLASVTYPTSPAQQITLAYTNAPGDFRLRALTNTAGATLLSSFAYAYDAEGRITNLVEQLGGPLQTNQYGYDGLGELLAVTINGTNASAYTYDLAGNRTLERQGASAWQARFNPLNELQAKDPGLSATNTACQYDEENRLVLRTVGAAQTRLYYNGLGRLMFANEYSGTNVTTQHGYVWDGDQIAEEYDSGGRITDFFWLYSLSYFDSYDGYAGRVSRDGLGSVREDVEYPNGSPILVRRNDYDAFGRQTVVSDPFPSTRVPTYGYANLLPVPGQTVDLARHRVYDPDTGRWLSRDPAGEAAGLNLYEYANNDPVNQVDPSGLCPVRGTVLGEGQYRDANGDLRDANGDLLRDPLDPLNPLNFEGGNSPLKATVEQAALGAAEGGGVASLRPYNEDGGHHIPAKSAFTGEPAYDANTALAIPNSELAALGISHSGLTGSQQTLYRAYAQTGQPLTWEAMQSIETQALVKGGMSPASASATVNNAINALKASGVSGPTRIPWGEN